MPGPQNTNEVIDSFKAAVSAGNVEAAAEAAYALGDDGVKAAVPLLLQVLARNNRIEFKNAAAIALRELRAAEALPVLLKLINDPEYATKNGTFVYAIETLPWWREHTSEVVQLLKNDNFEAREMALQALEAAVKRLKADQRRELVQTITSYLFPHRKMQGAVAQTLWAALFLLLGRPLRKPAELSELS